jgi:CRISPR-associated protein (TIGR02710 family)
MPILLIATVGSAPEPVAASLASQEPEGYERVFFVCSADTRATLTGAGASAATPAAAGAPGAKGRPTVMALARNLGCEPRPGQFDVVVVPDPQDLAGCTETLRRALDPRVRDWQSRGAEFRVVADITGGTKCMSVALGLVARRWDCLFRYIGGEERTGGRTGVVVNGREQVVYGQNPWNALGFEAAEQAATLFDAGDCATAARLLDTAKRRASAPHVVRALASLEALAAGFAAWDRFDHKAARARLQDAARGSHDLAWFFGEERSAALRLHLEAWVSRCPASTEPAHPTRELLLDVLANARRRMRELRFDDAVARLYRAVELMAQVRLAAHGLETRAVPVERIPRSCRAHLQPLPDSGVIACGLQAAYTLLDGLGDDLGKAFTTLAPDRTNTPLEMRNQSILAHGFQPVGEAGCGKVWAFALRLAAAMGIGEPDLPEFPSLRGTERV